MEVEDEKFKLRDANQAILEAKTAVHSFNEKKFDDIVVGKGFESYRNSKAGCSGCN